MEIQVLKETCKDRFSDFIKNLEAMDKKEPLVAHRTQAIKLIQLLKGSPGYRNIVEPHEDDKTMTPEEIDDDIHDDDDRLLNYENKEYRFYKQISNQTENFDKALIAAP